MSRRSQKGQAIILVLVALSLCLIAMIGLAIDASQLYCQRQMAQAAADAAAQAGIMSVFDKTNTAAFNNAFAPAPFFCGAGDTRTPCTYARNNGFDPSNGDSVHVEFPPAGTEPGVVLSPEFPINLIRVTVIRPVKTSLMQFLGVSLSGVAAQATAAIVDVLGPVPLIVNHPTRNPSFSISGNNTIRICGGPRKSIQVNSSNATSINVNGSSGKVDLSKAGPKDPGNCTTGTGADFGDFGGPNPYPGTMLLGTTGHYVQPASPMLDPIWVASVPAPGAPGNLGVATPVTAGVDGCPAATCTLYSPGLWNSTNWPAQGIKNDTALFLPGIYYMSGVGFNFGANGNALMANNPTLSPTGCPAPDPVTGCGIMVYMTGNRGLSIPANAGSTAGIQLLGACIVDALGNCSGAPASTYDQILFFEDRTQTNDQGHSLQGGGLLKLKGTIYLTNDLRERGLCLPGVPCGFSGQSLNLGGNPGSTTTIQGQIIADVVNMNGNPTITMQLDPTQHPIPQVALVR